MIVYDRKRVGLVVYDNKINIDTASLATSVVIIHVLGSLLATFSIAVNQWDTPKDLDETFMLISNTCSTREGSTVKFLCNRGLVSNLSVVSFHPIHKGNNNYNYSNKLYYNYK